MKKVKVSQLKPGFILAEAIPHPYSYNTYLEAGTLLTPYHIKRILELKIEALSIVDQRYLSWNQLNFRERMALAQELYSNTYQAIDKLFTDVLANRDVEVSPLKEKVKELVAVLTGDPHFMLYILSLKKTDDATLSHSLNVGILAVLLGQALGYCSGDCVDLGLAGVLHDIGKAHISIEVLQKNGPLTHEEFCVIQEHPIIGHSLAKLSPEVTPRILHPILQHHEKLDGSGYPFGLKAEHIDTWSKIITIADIYDALTSDRSYRARFLPHQAMEYLMAQTSNGSVDRDITSLFIKNIAIYPIGARVVLTNNEVGEVVDIPLNLPWRPSVLVGQQKKRVIHLTDHPNIQVMDLLFP